jgi:hypothetical protein
MLSASPQRFDDTFPLIIHSTPKSSVAVILDRMLVTVRGAKERKSRFMFKCTLHFVSRAKRKTPIIAFSNANHDRVDLVRSCSVQALYALRF